MQGVQPNQSDPETIPERTHFEYINNGRYQPAQKPGAFIHSLAFMPASSQTGDNGRHVDIHTSSDSGRVPNLISVAPPVMSTISICIGFARNQLLSGINHRSNMNGTTGTS